LTQPDESRAIAAEQARILAEYRRRERDVEADLYAPWQAATSFMRAGRGRLAARMLKQAGVFPGPGDSCLEIGYGSLGWLGELVAWGVREGDLHGIELDETRARRASEILPGADLRVGDATRMPWAAGTFRLIIASTVFSSILDASVRQAVAAEVARVLAPGGALLWYDMAVNNPRNPNVRGIGRRELAMLFPTLPGKIHSVTLAPPLARWAAPKSWILSELLEAIPFLRTHVLAVLVKR
jgi:ubiquinone/menaquinone biosynthesis C-methylase UbiE